MMQVIDPQAWSAAVQSCHKEMHDFVRDLELLRRRALPELKTLKDRQQANAVANACVEMQALLDEWRAQQLGEPAAEAHR